MVSYVGCNNQSNVNPHSVSPLVHNDDSHIVKSEKFEKKPPLIVSDTPPAQQAKTDEKSVLDTHKSNRNRVLALLSLGAVVAANPIHHVEHALIHGVLGPVVSNTLLDPVTKFVTGNTQTPHLHGSHGTNNHSHSEHQHNTKEANSFSNKAMNFATEIYHGMMHHLVTQIVFDQMLGLFTGSKLPAKHHH